MYVLVLLAVLAIHGTSADSCCSVDVIQPAEDLSVVDAYRNHKVLGDYLYYAPSDLLVGSHGSYVIKPGTIMSPLLTTLPMKISYPNGTKGEKYTLILLGIDTPSRENSSERAYINALYVNCPYDEILEGDVVVPYVPAIPVLGSGAHRYIGLLYKQQGSINPNSKDLLLLARNRIGFSATNFAYAHKLGCPVAGNLFITDASLCSN